MRARLVDAIDPATDSRRFNFLGREWRSHVDHVGAKPSERPDELLIA